MLRAVMPCCTQVPGALDKEKEEDSKKYAGDFKPENAAGMNKGTPDGFTKPFGAASRS